MNALAPPTATKRNRPIPIPPQIHSRRLAVRNGVWIRRSAREHDRRATASWCPSQLGAALRLRRTNPPPELHDAGESVVDVRLATLQRRQGTVRSALDRGREGPHADA